MRVTVTVPDAVGRQAEEAAQEEGTSVSALFAAAVEAYLASRRRAAAASRIDRWIGKAKVAPDAVERLHRYRRTSDRDVG